MKCAKAIIAVTVAFVGSVQAAFYSTEMTEHLAFDKSHFVEDWDKDGKKCLKRSKRGGQMLFPGEMELTLEQQRIFRNLIEHIVEIHDEMERDSFRHLAAVKDSTRQWKKISQCLSFYKLIRVEELTDSFIALRELGKSLRKIRWKHGEATTALTDDLVVYTVRLIGFLNTMYDTSEIPNWLMDAPGQGIGSLLSYLSFDIRQPHGCTLARD